MLAGLAMGCSKGSDPGNGANDSGSLDGDDVTSTDGGARDVMPEDAATGADNAASDVTDAGSADISGDVANDGDASGVDTPDGATSDGAGDDATLDADGAGDANDAGCENTCTGTCIAGRCQVTIESELHAYNIAVNATHIYWTTTFTAPVPAKVMRAPLDGGQREELATGPNCHSIVLDDTNVYWTDFTRGSGFLMKMPLNGGTPVPIVTNQDGPHGLAIDKTHIYWTNYDGGQVKRASLSDGTITSIADGQAHPDTLALDDTFVYWTNSVDNSGTIMKAPLDGSSPPVAIVTDQNWPYAVAVDKTNIYWTVTHGGLVMKMPLDRSAPAVALASQQSTPWNLVVDDTDVYWMNLENESTPNDPGQGVRKVPIGGGAWTPVEPQGGYGLAVDSHSVYWAVYGTADDAGTIVVPSKVVRMTPK
jgi:hypothetical protein